MKTLPILLLSICGVLSMPIDKAQPAQLTVVDVAKVVEGFLYGIMDKEFHNLDSCISDVQTIAQDV